MAFYQPQSQPQLQPQASRGGHHQPQYQPQPASGVPRSHGPGSSGGSSAERPILFVSQYCAYCIDVLELIASKDIEDRFVVVSIDRNRHQIPSFVDRVPLILTPARDVLVDAQVDSYILAMRNARSELLTGEPIAVDVVGAGGCQFQFVDDAAGMSHRESAIFGFLDIEGMGANDNYPHPTTTASGASSPSSGTPDRAIPAAASTTSSVGAGMARGVPAVVGMGDALPPPIVTSSASFSKQQLQQQQKHQQTNPLDNLVSSRQNMLQSWWDEGASGGAGAAAAAHAQAQGRPAPPQMRSRGDE